MGVVTFTPVNTWEGSGGKQLKSPGGSGTEGHAPVSGRGSWGRGLGLRGPHPAMGEGARKRKGLALQGSALAHGVTSSGHHSGSQGRALSGEGGRGWWGGKDHVLALGCGRRKHNSSLASPTSGGSLLKRCWEESGWHLSAIFWARGTLGAPSLGPVGSGAPR